MKTALVLIDTQIDYFSGGDMVPVGANGASANAVKLLKAVRGHQIDPGLRQETR